MISRSVWLFVIGFGLVLGGLLHMSCGTLIVHDRPDTVYITPAGIHPEHHVWRDGHDDDWHRAHGDHWEDDNH